MAPQGVRCAETAERIINGRQRAGGQTSVEISGRAVSAMHLLHFYFYTSAPFYIRTFFRIRLVEPMLAYFYRSVFLVSVETT